MQPVHSLAAYVEGGKQGQQEAYLYAGNRLAFNSGRDTTIAGAQLEGEQVVGRVGRDLWVASVPDTGKVSGSVGVGKTTGSTDWVDSQTRIVARDELDIRTEKHTQLDGAVLASKTGNLKLDTDTLGFRDLEGHDRERSWYINAGGTYSWGGDSTDGSGQSKDGNAAATQAVVDSSQDNKDGSNQWNVSGYHSKKEREQIVRATVGEGEIIVRNDAETGRDSTQNLNRDTDKAYEITQDKQETTKLYVSSTSLEAMGSPVTTVKNWAEELSRYDEKLIANFEQLSIGANVGYNRIERALGRQLVSDGYTSQQLAEQALEALLLGGMGLGDAKVLITSEAFQQQVLAELTAINGLSEAQIREAGQLLAGGAEEAAPDASGTAPTAGASALVLPDLLVTPQDLDALQQVLRHSASVQKYIDDNPDKALAVGVVLSALQGPKGLMQLAVMQALSGTELGAELNAYLAELQDAAGQLIAEGMEGSILEPADYEDDRWLTGGGGLLASIVTGGLPGKGTKVTKPKRDVSVEGKGGVGTAGASNTATATGSAARNIALAERQKAAYAAQEIKNATPVGSALKDDPLHRAPSYVVDKIPESGQVFALKGGDGLSYNLTQMEGVVNGKFGVYEWIVNSKGELSHQRFIAGGKITGVPNQIPARRP